MVSRAKSWFTDVDTAAPIEVFNLTAQYNEDSHPGKVNLGIGAYRTEESLPWVLPVVRTVESQMAADMTSNHEYLPVAGLKDFRVSAVKLLLGEDSSAICENRTEGIQALGGTGALRIGLDFLHSRLGLNSLYCSSPTWGNHKGIAKSLGYQHIKDYRYIDPGEHHINIKRLVEDLRNAEEASVVLLHTCAHNPTGYDPSHEEWKQIAEVIQEKGHFPFFDSAYQGFSSGSLEQDAWPIRFFVSQGFELFAAQSFSKNFGLYNERIGNLAMVVKSSEDLVKVRSQMEIIVRTTWSNSNAHGARIVATILNNPALVAEWKDHVRTMAERILLMRQKLFEKLRALGTPGTWDHIIKQTGMFSYTGLNTCQVKYLIQRYHIYLLKNGRINMCGLTLKSIDYVAAAIHDAVSNIKDDPSI